MIKDMQEVSDDIIEMKRVIKQKLIENRDILEALNNKEIPLDCPDEYLGKNIFGFMRIPQTADTVRNSICFIVEDIKALYTNDTMKQQYVQFNVICNLNDMHTKYGIERHDLISALIRETFNWTNDLGLQFKLVSNTEMAVERDYYCRTLKFEATKLNSLNKAKMESPYDKLRR